MAKVYAMNQTAMLGLVATVMVIGLCGFLAWSVWERARLVANTIDRIAPALLEPEEFFELVDISGRRSHFLERHGPMLKLTEIEQRARTGNLSAAGLIGKPVSSGRWLRHSDLVKAVNAARHHWSNGARPQNGVFRFRFPNKIGEGYTRSSRASVATNCAIVVIRGETVITAYPAVDDAITSGWLDEELSDIPFQ